MSVPDGTLAWCRTHYAMMADGGVWGVPRSGLMFVKRNGGLELDDRMPWTRELAYAAAEGFDVPLDAEAFRAYQDADFELIRERFEAAGIAVRDATVPS